jgi:hypothetical protein
MSQSPSTYEVVYPNYFDVDAGDIRARGYFADLVVIVGDRRLRPTIMTAQRLAAESEIELSGAKHCYFEPNLVIVREVTRSMIDAAIDDLSQIGFKGLCAE